MKLLLLLGGLGLHERMCRLDPPLPNVRHSASHAHRAGDRGASRRLDRRQLPVARGRQHESRGSGEGDSRGRSLDRRREPVHASGSRQSSRPCGARRAAAAAHGSRVGHGAPRAGEPVFLHASARARQNQAVVYWREGVSGESRVLIDPAALDSTGLTTVEWFSPSPTAAHLAYGTYRAGDENTTLHLLDVDTAQGRCRFEIPSKTQAPDWLPDGSGFVYQNLKNAKDPYSGQVLFHRMGRIVSRDAVLFRQFTRAENEKLATTWGPFGSLSRDGRWLVLGYWVDTKSNDLWLVDFERFLRTGRVERRVVIGRHRRSGVRHRRRRHADRADDEGRAERARGRGEHRGARGRPTGATSSRRGRTPSSKASSFGKGVVAVTYLKNASNVVEVFDIVGTFARRRSTSPASAPSRSRRRGSHRGIPDVHELQLSDDDLPRGSGEAAEPAPDSGSGRTFPSIRQPRRSSRSGTRRRTAPKISMFLVHKKGLARNGDTPTILYGLRRLQHQRDAGVFRDALSMARGRRPVRRAEPARRRRVRRRVARSRHARAQAEHLRRFHRRRGVADRERLHDVRRSWRSQADRMAGC